LNAQNIRLDKKVEKEDEQTRFMAQIYMSELVLYFYRLVDKESFYYE
jgi:hypothetical protein